MTKLELIKKLENYSDDDKVYIYTNCLDNESGVIQVELVDSILFRDGRGILLDCEIRRKCK